MPLSVSVVDVDATGLVERASCTSRLSLALCSAIVLMLLSLSESLASSRARRAASAVRVVKRLDTEDDIDRETPPVRAATSLPMLVDDSVEVVSSRRARMFASSIARRLCEGVNAEPVRRIGSAGGALEARLSSMRRRASRTSTIVRMILLSCAIYGDSVAPLSASRQSEYDVPGSSVASSTVFRRESSDPDKTIAL